MLVSIAVSTGLYQSMLFNHSFVITKIFFTGTLISLLIYIRLVLITIMLIIKVQINALSCLLTST